MELNDVDSIIRNRRSIYTNMFSGAEVPDEIIKNMLENGRWAPTHKMTEPWQYVVFKGKGLERLASFQAETYKKKSTAEGTFDETVFSKFRAKPLECSHVIAIGMHREENKSLPEIEEINAVACSVENMWITASAHRIGCYWSTGGITYYEGINSFFGWKDDDRLLGFLYIGMSKSDKWPAGKRTPIEDKVQWITT